MRSLAAWKGWQRHRSGLKLIWLAPQPGEWVGKDSAVADFGNGAA
jgi:hypothetical protein